MEVHFKINIMKYPVLGIALGIELEFESLS